LLNYYSFVKKKNDLSDLSLLCITNTSDDVRNTKEIVRRNQQILRRSLDTMEKGTIKVPKFFSIRNNNKKS